jgi:autotransporter-associated beta strand protein
MTGYDALSLGAAADVGFSGAVMPAGNTYQLGGGPGTLTVNSVLADYGDTPCGAAINGNVVFAATNTYSGDTSVLNGTLTLGNIYALPAGSNVFVTGVNSLLQCCDGAQIGGNVALNDGGSINAGNGSLIAGNLAVTSLVNGVKTFNTCYWTGDGAVQGTVTINDGGILSVGQDGPATLSTAGGMLVSGSGQVLVPDPGSAIVGSVDFEGWQSDTIIGAIQGTGNTLTVNSGVVHFHLFLGNKCGPSARPARD